MRRVAVSVLVAMSLVLVSACGARLSSQQRTLAIRHPATAATSGPVVAGGPTTGPAVGGPQTHQQQPGVAQQVPGTGVTGPRGVGGPTTGPQQGGGKTGPVAAGPACAATSKNNGGKTDTGVSATEIDISNVSDISGPVPGLFQSVEQAAQAFVTYFNASHPDGICGRMLHLLPKDSATDSGTNRAKTEDACHDSFALIGSMSAFDDGGVGPINDCGIVDLSAVAVTRQRQGNANSFSASAASTHWIASAVPRYFKEHDGDAVRHAAFLYIDAGAAAQNAHSWISGWPKAGWQWSYTAGLPVQNASTQGFKPYVQRMKDKGVQVVCWVGAYQEAASLAQAMDQSDFHPKVFLLDPTGYNPGYLQLAGSAAEGTYLYDDAVPLTGSSSPEMALYRQWLQRTGVSDAPTYFGQFAWSAMRLFTDLAYQVGPNLTRKAITQKLRTVKNWTGHGLTAPQDVGTKHSHGCEQMYQVHNNQFTALTQGFICAPLIHVS